MMGVRRHYWSELASRMPVLRPRGVCWLAHTVCVQNQEIVMTYTYREAVLNWLALGMLLAAWNASDDNQPPAAKPPARPDALRDYLHISVRAATRSAGVQRGFTVL